MVSIKVHRAMKLEESELIKMIKEHKVSDLKKYLDARDKEFLLSPEITKAAFKEFLAQDETYIVNSHEIIGALHDYIMDDKRKARYRASREHDITIELCELYERTASHKSAKAGDIVKLKTARDYERKVKVVEAWQEEIKEIGDVKGKLERHFTDRKVAGTSEFERAGAKNDGVSAGYMGKRKEDKHTFMLKAAKKSGHYLNSLQQQDDSRDFINEYIMAPLYRRMLFDRAPIFELTVEGEVDSKNYGTPKADKNSANIIYGRSKFFDDFKILAEFAGQGGTRIEPDHENLKSIEGFEKVIAACLFAGEADYHPGNLGVVSKVGDDGKVHNTIVKIDHGRSAIKFFADEKDLVVDMLNRFRDLKYEKIPFDIKKFKEAMDAMLEISDEEIENMVKSRFDILIKNDFEFKDIKILRSSTDTTNIVTTIRDDRDDTIQALMQQYIEPLKQQKAALKQLSAKLETILEIDFGSKEGKANSLRAINLMDPIVYAVINKLTIKGKAPIIYAIENNKVSSELLEYAIINGITINTESPLEYAIKHKKVNDGIVVWAILNNMLLEGKDPLLYAILNEIKIDGIGVIAYAVKHGHKIGGMDPIEYAVAEDKVDNELVGQLIKKGKRITGQDPCVYAIENKMLIDGKSPSAYAFINNVKEIDGLPTMDYILDNGLMDRDILSFAIDSNKKIDSQGALEYAIDNQFEGFDPIRYAILKEKSIDGMEPVYYALKNKIEIDGKNPIDYVTENFPDRRLKVDAITWAIENNKSIYDKDPVLYAIESNQAECIEYAIKGGMKFEKEHLDSLLAWYISAAEVSKEPWYLKALKNSFVLILKALNNNTEDVSPALYALRNGIKFNNKNPADYFTKGFHDSTALTVAVGWAIINNTSIDGKNPMVYACGYTKGDQLIKQQIDNGMEVGKEHLAPLLEEYVRAMQAGEDAGYIKRLEAGFNHVQKALNKDKPVTMLDANSPLGQFLHSAPSFVIAEKLGAKPRMLSATKVDEDLMASCSLDVLVRIVKVAKHIDTGLKETPVTYFLHMFVDLLKNLAGKGAADPKVKDAADSIASMEKAGSSFAEKLAKAAQELQSKGRE